MQHPKRIIDAHAAVKKKFDQWTRPKMLESADLGEEERVAASIVFTGLPLSRANIE
jgi:hypothetical protein